MRVLIIGLGSIARKHIAALRVIYKEVEIFALRSGKSESIYEFDNVTNTNDWLIAETVDFIIISNPTSLHGETILKALNYKKPLFIEKPVMHNLDLEDEIKAKLQINQIKTYVACVLRFHPILKNLKRIINTKKERINEVNVYCGSYLPDWRPGRDWKSIYSAKEELGGGVHLDMIHEMDYIYWFFGKPLQIKSTFRNQSHLEIEVSDYANYQLIYEGFVVNLIVNYYRRLPKREIEVLYSDAIYKADLINKNLTEEVKNQNIYVEGKDIDLYLEQMKNFVYDDELQNDFTEGCEVLRLSLGRV